MRDELEKMHPVLQQNYLYQRERRIVSLVRRLITDELSILRLQPPFMIVHMVRFEWKKAAPLAGGKAGRAKILRVSRPIYWHNSVHISAPASRISHDL